ncbi:phosphoglucomutase, alpha-D-glucose phosphate-specific, partial [Burkholderia multivorans]
YLLENRPEWPAEAAIGKTLVTSSIVDRVVAAHGRRVFEVPVGFKWFVPGLLDSTLAFGGEESAGASFLRRGGKVWSTDKDGIILALLASEMTAKTGQTPSQRYAGLAEKFGTSAYARQDAPANREQKARLGALEPSQVTASTIGGEDVTSVLTSAPGNDAPIGGLKVTTDNAWFAVRPSGTEDVYKIYAESLRDEDHLRAVQHDARS